MQSRTEAECIAHGQLVVGSKRTIDVSVVGQFDSGGSNISQSCVNDQVANRPDATDAREIRPGPSRRFPILGRMKADDDYWKAHEASMAKMVAFVERAGRVIRAKDLERRTRGRSPMPKLSRRNYLSN